MNTIKNKPVVLGNHYFVSLVKRTDEFARKRFTSPEAQKFERMILMGIAVEQTDAQVKLKLIDNNFEKDGQEFCYYKNNLIMEADNEEYKCLEIHGKINCNCLGKWV